MALMSLVPPDVSPHQMLQRVSGVKSQESSGWERIRGIEWCGPRGGGGRPLALYGVRELEKMDGGGSGARRPGRNIQGFLFPFL